MRFYDRHVLPRLTHLAMRQEQLRPYRERVVSAASGRVLEIGIGSGLNLPFYPDAVERVIGVDPSPGLLRLASEAARRSVPDTELIEGTAEELPVEDRSVDCAVVSWTLCSVMDPDRALAEIRRVLKPDGIFSVVEHGLAPGGTGPAMAALADARLVQVRRELPSRPADSLSGRAERLQAGAHRDRLCAGTEADDLHVRRAGPP